MQRRHRSIGRGHQNVGRGRGHQSVGRGRGYESIGRARRQEDRGPGCTVGGRGKNDKKK